MTLDPVVLKSLSDKLRYSILQRKIDSKSAFSIVVKGMEILDNYKQLSGQQKKEYIFAVVEELAKGADGISGTKDDILPPATVNALGALIRENILEGFIGIISDATKGKFDINKTVKTTISCLGFCIKQ